MPLLNMLSVILILFLFSSAVVAQEDCLPGTFFDGSSCELCPSGTYQFKNGQTSCSPCPPGTYFPFSGGQGRDVCLPCPKNTFNDKEGATSKSACRPCPRGTASDQYSSRCLSCPPGTKVSVCGFDSFLSLGRCRSCHRFFCIENEPRPVCTVCESNYFSSARNSRKCSVCPLDSESAPRAANCRKCPRKGCQGCNDFEVYDPISVVDDPFVSFFKIRSSGCTRCPAGFVGNREVNATRCVRCAPGTFRNDTSSGPCLPCSSDSGTNAAGSSCVVCNKQQKFNARLQKCEACPKNHKSAGGKATVCELCPLGSIGSRNGCECLPGWAPSSDGVCRICPSGSQGPHFFERHCSTCRYMSIAPSAGTPAGGCRRCPSGTVSNQKPTECIPFSCPEGLLVGVDTCVSPSTNCAPGKTRRNFLSDGLETYSCT